MGASPQQKAMDAAQASVDEAVSQGMQLAKDLQKRGKKYRGMAEESQQDILGYLGEGNDPASYYSRITQGFGELPSMPEQQAKWQAQLNEGDYPVLGTPSHKRFEDTLMRSVDMYRQGIAQGLNEVQPRFAAISKDPSFNLQYDPRAMQLAQGNINEDQVRRLTSYNV